MGTGGTPTIPLFIGQGANGDLEWTPGNKPGIGPGDGVMIAGDVRTLARTYCEKGTTVYYEQYASAQPHHERPVLASESDRLDHGSLRWRTRTAELFVDSTRQLARPDSASAGMSNHQPSRVGRLLRSIRKEIPEALADGHGSDDAGLRRDLLDRPGHADRLQCLRHDQSQARTVRGVPRGRSGACTDP